MVVTDKLYAENAVAIDQSTLYTLSWSNNPQVRVASAGAGKEGALRRSPRIGLIVAALASVALASARLLERK